jgi:FAD dependent oxidoreductase TIGR03364
MPAATPDVSLPGARVNMRAGKNYGPRRRRGPSFTGVDHPRKSTLAEAGVIDGYDLAIVGSGVVGLAHALAAARLGKRVVVIDRDARANGASIRNFGFVTVTGQGRGAPWRRASRSRDVWAQVAPLAGVAIEQRGLIVTLRMAQSLAAAEAFLATEMGEGCVLLDPREASRRFPEITPPGLVGVLHSSRDLRVESRVAIPRLAAWLEAAHGVSFVRGATVFDVAPPKIETSRGAVRAAAAVVCPGDELSALYPEIIAAHGVRRCALSMLRLADPGVRMPATLMSDLSLGRYRGYAELPAAQGLVERLNTEHAEAVARGVHLIVAQGADGSLIVGDSHRYDEVAEPFMATSVERLILAEFEAATGLAPPPVIERWTGSYAWAPATDLVIERPAPDVRLVIVTAGNGASTAFALGEQVIGDLYGVSLETVPVAPRSPGASARSASSPSRTAIGA